MSSSSPRYDVLTFGEGLLRLSTPRYERLEQTATFDVHVAGEAIEVAVAASRLGLRTAWLSVLTDNPLGRKIVNKAREQGVDTSSVRWVQEGRIGLTYTEAGSAPRASLLMDDIAATGFGGIQEDSIDWAPLRDSRLLHIDSTVPALYPASMPSLKTGLAEAQDAGCEICVCMSDTFADCSNDAQQRVLSIAEQANIIITTRTAAACIRDGADTLEDQAAALKDRFKTSVVAVVDSKLPTPRMGSWQGVAAGSDTYHDRPYDLEVIDASGAFSAFTGGFLYGYLKTDIRTGLRYGNAAAALAHSVPGNLTWITAEEITSQFSGAGSKLQR